MKTFFIVAGESSGDLHGAKLMRALKQQYRGCQFKGIGGDAMRAEGLDSLASLSDIAVVGFYEVAKKYGMFRKLMRVCKTEVASCDAFIPVDYPGFNIRLSTHAKSIGIPVLYYIAPQLWAWGKKRAAKLAAAIDHLLVVFPFEVEFFEQFGIATTFVGHPLLDEPALKDVPPAISERSNTLALMPGSRQQEIERHMKVMTDAASEFRRRGHADWEVCTAIPAHLSVNYAELSKANIRVVPQARETMLHASIGLVKTGTSNLEAALCGMPFAMMYRTSALSYGIARRLISLEYISLVNILLGKSVVPELIQQDAQPAAIAQALSDLSRPELALKQQEEFMAVRNLLGGPGASDAAARRIRVLLDGGDV